MLTRRSISHVSRMCMRYLCTTPRKNPFDEAGILQCLKAAEEEISSVDPEMYLCASYLDGPPGMRGAAIAIRGMNLELAKLVDYEGTHNARLLRFEWWRETIKSMAYKGEVNQNNPILRLVACAARSFKWEPSRLLFFIDARETLSRVEMFNNLEDIEAYSELINANTNYLLLSCWPGELTEEQTFAASHVGAAIGLANYLRAVPYSVQDYRNHIPGQLLDEFGMNTMQENEAWMLPKTTPKCRKLMKHWCDRIEGHLDASWKYKKAFTRQQRTVLLQAMPARMFVERLKKNNYDIFSREVYTRFHDGMDKHLKRNLYVYRASGWY